MITIFEKYNKTKPKVGDYVLCTDKTKVSEGTLDFLSKNIGKIIFIYKNAPNSYKVSFDELPINTDFLYYESDKSVRYFNRSEILDFSDNKNDLETKLAADKYNL